MNVDFETIFEPRRAGIKTEIGFRHLNRILYLKQQGTGLFHSVPAESPTRRSGIVGKVWCISGGTINQVMPGGIATAGRYDEHFFKIALRQWIVTRLISEYAIRNFRAHEKRSRPTGQKGFHEWKRLHVYKPPGNLDSVHVHVSLLSSWLDFLK